MSLVPFRVSSLPALARVLAAPIVALALAPSTSAFQVCTPPPCPVITYPCNSPVILPVTGPCAPITGCAAGCPPSSLTVSVELPACDSGVRLDNSCIDVPKFDASTGTLKSVAVRVETRPNFIAYQVENTSAQSAQVPTAGNTKYTAFGFLDVLDPTALPNFLSRTSDKVDQGSPGTFCLYWSVSDTLGAGQLIPPFDGCADFNDPSINGAGCLAGHGGPAFPVADSATAPCACPGGAPGCCPTSGNLGGARTKYGRFATNPLPNVSGYTDRRDFTNMNGVFPANETYVCEKCYTDAPSLAAFTGATPIQFPINSLGGLAGINYSGGQISQRSAVQMRCRITVTYNFCPVPPTCQPFTIDMCRTTGTFKFVNVLSSVTAPVAANCVGGGIDCTVLTGTQNLTQPTYGSVAWVDDASCVNSFCNLRCIKYTLNTLPPTNRATDSFTYTVRVPGGCSTTCTVTVNIASPVCAPDTGDVCRTLSSTALVNVLLNDTSFRALNCPAVGATTGLTNGTYGSTVWAAGAANALCTGKVVRYTLTSLPPVGTTTDTFNYTITDTNGCTATCPVTITIASPVCAPDTGDVCRTLSSTTLVNVLLNDTSLRPLNCPAVASTTGLTNGTYGSTVWAAGAANALCTGKVVRYTLTSLPPVGTTTDTFNYTITDTNGCTATCPVTITIASPVCAPDTGDVCRTLSSTALVNVLLNDTSLRPLACRTIGTTTGLTNGTYGSTVWAAGAVNPLCSGTVVRYTLTTLPPVGTTTDTFNYTITDTNGCTATCPVTITIASPVCAPDTGDVCRTLSSTTLVNVLLNDSSLRPLNCPAVASTTGLTNGTYGSTVWAAGAANALCTGKVVRYTLTSLPPVGTTTDTFNYTITDTNGCTATCPVTITIASPVCAPDTGDVCRTLTSFTNVNVLFNDTSTRPLNCGGLTGTSGLTNGTYGSTVWNNDAACVNSLCNMKCVKYTLSSLPPVGTTTDTFNYTITDTNGCTATCPVTITIASPACVDDCVDLCATVGGMVKVNVLGNDASLRPINCALLTGTAALTQGTYGSTVWTTDPACTNSLCNQTCVKYTLNSIPPVGINGDAFTYTITDTNGCPVTCSVQVKLCKLDAVNDGPVMVCAGVGQKICVLDNDTSTCGSLSCANLAIAVPPLHGLVQIVDNCNGLPNGCGATATGCTGCCLVYTSETGYSGPDSFTYRLSTTSTGCPGGTPITCTDTAVVTIAVKPSPIANDDMYDLGMNGTVGPFDVRDNDTPGIGCELAGCGAPCAYSGCPVIIEQPLHGMIVVDPVTCKMTYTATPGVPFPGSDRFCYRITNNCGCCDTACVTISECPCINRRQPGSLLLYPEYDTRPGQTTFITITNSSCAFPNYPVIVEFIYIDKTTCGEVNATRTLTPCDTLTLIANAQNPNPTRGYMYAFAKDAQNRPISFNFLIGDLMVVDGIEHTSYGINPVSFRSPLDRGVLTDLDADGIRDLNGLEYDPAPDEIAIPRFLGQDPPGTGALFKDELVVLALSGGVSFQTSIHFSGYNDNEVPFSVDKTFYCWEKWRLSDISGAFNNSFLKGLGDDVLEIIGAPTRETGWFRLQGKTAFSTVEQINDPAIYAFLIERADNKDRVAELPWEICTQGNGDLLPLGPLGDGPVPVNGDNQ